MTPIISVIGGKNAGKTTLIESLIRELAARRLRVAALKHDVHGFEMDTPGKDTFRFARAGADAVGIVCPTKAARIERLEHELPPEEFLAGLSRNVDLLLVEGYKRRHYPKILVLGGAPVESRLAPFLKSPLLIATFCRERARVRHAFVDAGRLARDLMDLFSAPSKVDASAFILGGGESRRFGSDKAFAELAGEPLVQWAVRAVRPFFRNLHVVTRSPERFREHTAQGVMVLPDLMPEPHSLGGIYSALVQCRTEHAFICACDTPFIQPRLIKSLKDAANGADAVVCRREGSVEPFCGIYSKRCLLTVQKMLKAGRLRIQELFGRVKTRCLTRNQLSAADPEGYSFMDVDTRADLKKAEGLLC